METTTIKQAAIFTATPDKLYAGFTDPKIHATMTGAGATGGERVGDDFTAWDGYIFGKVLELKPNKLIVQEWQATDWPEDYPPSRLEIQFAPHADGTELTLIQTNVPTESAKSYDDGWKAFYWKPMKKYFTKKK